MLQSNCGITSDLKSTMEHVIVDAAGEATVITLSDTPSPEIVGSMVEVASAWALEDASGSRMLGASLTDLAVRTLAAARPASTATKSALLVLLRFSDFPTEEIITDAQLKDLETNLTNFYQEGSMGSVSFSVAATPPLLIPMKKGSFSFCSVSNRSTMQQQASAALAKAGFDEKKYNFVSLFFPNLSAGCRGLGGVGQLGGKYLWMDASQRYLQGGLLPVVAHEMGHNFGLPHASYNDCTAIKASPIIGDGVTACPHNEYGDLLDTMGFGSTPHYSLYFRERLGWVNQANTGKLQTLTAGGTFSLDAYETSNTNLKGVKFAKNAGNFYYVEYRQPIGFDRGRSGVVVHLGNTSFQQSELLNFQGNEDWNTPYLKVGQTFTDAQAGNGGVTIKVLSAGAGGASISVTFGNDAKPPGPAGLAAHTPYSIKSAVNGDALENYAFSKKNDSLVGIWSANQGSNQVWSLNPLRPDVYEVINSYSNMCMYTAGASKVVGGVMHQWPCRRDPDTGPRFNFSWKFVPKAAGRTFALVNEDSGLCLAMPANNQHGVALHQEVCSDALSQQWVVAGAA